MIPRKKQITTETEREKQKHLTSHRDTSAPGPKGLSASRGSFTPLSGVLLFQYKIDISHISLPGST